MYILILILANRMFGLRDGRFRPLLYNIRLGGLNMPHALCDFRNIEARQKTASRNDDDDDFDDDEPPNACDLLPNTCDFTPAAKKKDSTSDESSDGGETVLASQEQDLLLSSDL
jgi:hypothetical protein